MKGALQRSSAANTVAAFAAISLNSALNQDQS